MSIPLLGYPSLPAAPFAGKTVLDTGNYYPQRDGRIEALDSGSLTDSEYLAQHLPGAQVVKVFNNIFYKHLLNLPPGGHRVAVTGDRTVPADRRRRCRGEAFRRRVPRLDRLRGGRRGTARRWLAAAAGTPVYGTPYGEFENEKGTPADAEVIRAALAAATRM